MPETSAQMHTTYQRKLAFDTAQALRIMDPEVRRAVLRHFRNADLPGSARKIEQALQGYHDRLAAVLAARATDRPPAEQSH